MVDGLRSWVYAQRRDNQSQTAALVAELLELGTPAKKLDLLRTLYIVPYCRDEALLNSGPEIELVRRQKTLFVEANCVRDYVACTLWGLRHDWSGLKAHYEEAMRGSSRNARESTTRKLVELLQEVLASDTGAKLPADLLPWFWNQLVETADLGCIDREERWYVGEILSKLGKAPMKWLVNAVRCRAHLHALATGLGFDPPSSLAPLVEIVDTHNANEPEVQNAVGELVALLDESPLMQHWLPKVLARVDPGGLEIPRRLATLIERETDPASVRKLVRTACYYGAGTPPWRQIARPAFKAAEAMPREYRIQVYDSSSDTGRRSWNAAAGTVAQFFVDAVETAKRGREEEGEREFVPFWEWRVQSAEAELRRQQEELKEEVWD